MSITAISVRPRSFISKLDKGSLDPTVFTVRTLDLFEFSEIQQRFRGKEETSTFDLLLAYLDKGLLDWKTLKDSEGGDLPFSREGFRFLPLTIVNELVAEITGALAPEPIKNSKEPLSSGSGSETKGEVTSGSVVPA